MAKSGWVAIGVAVAVVSGASSAADAALMLRLTSGLDTVTITDGLAGDLNATAGIVKFSGAVGGFSINISTGTSKPVIGNGFVGQLDLSSIDVSGPSAGTLEIALTDTDFTQENITGGSLAIAGFTGGTVDMQSYIDFNNTAFGQDIELADLGPFVDGPDPGSTAFSDIDFSSISGEDNTPPFSLTIVASIMHTGAFQISSFDGALEVFSEPGDEVPAPASLAVLGFGLLWLGVRKRRAARQALRHPECR